MTDEYLKMILALPEEFFNDWEWNDGDQVYLTEEIFQFLFSIHFKGFKYSQGPFFLRIYNEKKSKSQGPSWPRKEFWF